ncbi:MAG: DUF3943 domain-containing protein [Tannerellaceae bacterium]|jgi:hypothetical protein|nr:DUF3943 domain-containing protein [Tannerellaceae bacterium]
MWKRISLLTLFLVCFSFSGKPQFDTKKDWGAAIGLTWGSNVAIWSFNRFIARSDFAYIGLNTVKENFKKGFVWDNDKVGTNMFGHPYHGSLYFNAARSNGFSFWEAGGFNLGGSLMWEMLMENEYPSINDLVTTPVGGLILGETFYRLSDVILDDRAVGFERFGRELTGLVVSPVRGINRIIRGDAWRKRNASGRQFGIPDISVRVAVGMRALELKDELFDKGVGMTTTLHVEYGDRFATKTEKPYDYFMLNANLHVQKMQPVLGQINIKGRLYSTGLMDSPKDFLSLGVYQHFDYYDSDIISAVSPYVPYRFCAPASFGLGLVYDNKRFRKWKIDSFFHANVILMGASLSDHYVVDDRNYNLANGFSWQWGINLSNRKKFSASLHYEGFRFFTWKGYDKEMDWGSVDPRSLNVQGDESQAISQALHFRMEYKLANRLYLTGTYSNYFRETTYRYFDDVFSQTSEGKFMLTYFFKSLPSN